VKKRKWKLRSDPLTLAREPDTLEGTNMKIEVEIKNGYVTTVKTFKNTIVKEFNYDVDRFQKSQLENDKNGKLCKQTHWVSDKPHTNKFQIEIRGRKISKVLLPKGSEIIVRIYKEFYSQNFEVKSYKLGDANVPA